MLWTHVPRISWIICFVWSIYHPDQSQHVCVTLICEADFSTPVSSSMSLRDWAHDVEQRKNLDILHPNCSVLHGTKVIYVDLRGAPAECFTKILTNGNRFHAISFYHEAKPTVMELTSSLQSLLQMLATPFCLIEHLSGRAITIFPAWEPAVSRQHTVERLWHEE